MSSPTVKEAVYCFFSSFGIPAYEENQLAVKPELPYITYSDVSGCFYDGGLSAHAQIWYKDNFDWQGADAICNLISERVGGSGAVIPCEGGGIFIRRSRPFSENLTEKSDKTIRKKQVNLIFEFITSL